MNVTGTKMLMAAFSGMLSELSDIMTKAYAKTAQHFVMKVKSKRMKRTCHSLEDLAELGHPYAKNYPKNMWKTASSRSGGMTPRYSGDIIDRYGGMNAEAVLGHDLTKIHRQGEDGIYKAMTYELKRSHDYYVIARAGIEEGHPAEEYAGYVFHGTDKMIARNALEEQLKEMKDELKDKVHVYFSNEFWKAVDKQPFFKKGRR